MFSWNIEKTIWKCKDAKNMIGMENREAITNMNKCHIKISE